jgi:arsenate reductase
MGGPSWPLVAYNVLFVCASNAATSIIAESLLNSLAGGRFRAFSGGDLASGRIHPMALEVLRDSGYSTTNLRSKGWDEFARPRAPAMDFVISLRDPGAAPFDPLLPGRPVPSRWTVTDPLDVPGESQRLAFVQALRVLRRRVQHLTGVPLDAFDRSVLGTVIDEIGRD